MAFTVESFIPHHRFAVCNGKGDATGFSRSLPGPFATLPVAAAGSLFMSRVEVGAERKSRGARRTLLVGAAAGWDSGSPGLAGMYSCVLLPLGTSQVLQRCSHFVGSPLQFPGCHYRGLCPGWGVIVPCTAPERLAISRHFLLCAPLSPLCPSLGRT